MPQELPMKQKPQKKFKGISLIETILYLAIAVFVLGMIFSYGWNITGLGVKTTVARKTLAAAEILRERMAYEIRQVESVNRGASNFGGSPARLVLRKTGGDIVIEETDGKTTIKRGDDAPTALHSGDIKMENMVFSEQVSAEDETEFVGFSFEAVADYPGSAGGSEYQYSLPIRSGAAIRNK